MPDHGKPEENKGNSRHDYGRVGRVVEIGKYFRKTASLDPLLYGPRAKDEDTGIETPEGFAVGYDLISVSGNCKFVWVGWSIRSYRSRFAEYFFMRNGTYRHRF